MEVRKTRKKKSSQKLGTSSQKLSALSSLESDPVLRDFSKSLPMCLLRAREAVMRQFRPMLRAHGITEQQWRILRALSWRCPQEITELAEETLLLAPSLSRILVDLESRKLIARRVVKTDGRRNEITITTAGRHLIAVVGPDSEAIYSKIDQLIGATNLEVLYSLLTEVATHLNGAASLYADDLSNSIKKEKLKTARKIMRSET